jgi:2-desacetyl-2-hydroxyethyl bacteriochlorophyllide A dehydrogenase
MQAKALICDEHQNFSFTEVILPEPASEHLLIQTHYSGVSIGTEFALIRNKLSWGPYPLCTGYMGVGTVEWVGARVTGFKVGDKVYYRNNRVGMNLVDGQAVSPVSGVHCSRAIINPEGTHGAALLPPGVDEAAASMFVLPAVGLYGVDMANPRMGEVVTVYGAGLIGLGVIAACSHRGCVVVAIDLEPSRLAIARKLGADYVIDASKQEVKTELEKIAPGGADVVFEATGIPACLDQAIALCRSYGKFILQGNYGAAPISYHFLPPHTKRLTMFYPCDDGFAPCRQAVLKNMAMGVLPWHHTITHRVKAEYAPELYQAINTGQAKEVLGAVLDWS